MKTIQIKAAWNGHSDCLSCGIRESVLFSDIPEAQFSDFHQRIDDLDFPRDAALFHQASRPSTPTPSAAALSKVGRGLA